MVGDRFLKLLLMLTVALGLVAMPSSVFASAEVCHTLNVTANYKIKSNANLYQTTGWVKLSKYYCYQNGEFTVFNQNLPNYNWSSNGAVTESMTDRGNWDIWFSGFDKGTYVKFNLGYMSCPTHPLKVSVEIDNDGPYYGNITTDLGGGPFCAQDTISVTSVSSSLS